MRKLLVVAYLLHRFPPHIDFLLVFSLHFPLKLWQIPLQDIFLPCQVFLRAPWCWSDSPWPTPPGSNLILALPTKTLGLNSLFRKYAQINHQMYTFYWTCHWACLHQMYVLDKNWTNMRFALVALLEGERGRGERWRVWDHLAQVAQVANLALLVILAILANLAILVNLALLVKLDFPFSWRF